MSRKPSHPPSDEVVGFFHRHMVPLYVTFRRGDEITSQLYSTFVLSVYDQWFLVTAGHCTEEIQAAIRGGYRVEKARLIDCMGQGASNLYPIPFDLEAANPIKLCYDPKYDYGLIFISDYYRRLLEQNGVVALTEQVWEQQPDERDSYLLIGVPTEFSDATGDPVRITTTLHPVEELPEKPTEFEETDAPTFWGKVGLGTDMTSIEGMSGGPLFSVRYREGEMRYWLHAVQSRWIPSKRYIAACLMKPLGGFIKEVMQGKHDESIEDIEREAS